MMLSPQRGRSVALLLFPVGVNFFHVREELGGGDEENSKEFCEGCERVPLGLRSYLANCDDEVDHLDG